VTGVYQEGSDLNRKNRDIVAVRVNRQPALVRGECQSALRAQSGALASASGGHATRIGERAVCRSVKDKNRISGGGIGHSMNRARRDMLVFLVFLLLQKYSSNASCNCRGEFSKSPCDSSCAN
jgi:hypothetical protein